MDGSCRGLRPSNPGIAGLSSADLLSGLISGTAVAGVVDGLATARDPTFGAGSAIDSIAAAAYVLPLFIAASLAFCLIAIPASAVVPLLATAGFTRSTENSTPKVGSVGPTVAALFMIDYQVAWLLMTRTHNHELAALVCALGSTVAVVVAATVAWASHLLLRALRFRLLRSGARSADSLTVFVGFLPLLLVIVWTGARHTEDLRIVGPWIVLIPLIALVLAALALMSLRALSRSNRRRFGLGVAVLCVASIPSSLAVSFTRPDIPRRLVRQRTWSPRLLNLARIASDVDRDGYSSLFGGGDCAAWQPSIHPGATEIPGDGVDNNCVGGDATRVVPRTPPEWFPPAESTARAPSIIVITVEALRADATSLSDPALGATPNLLRWSSRAVVFRHHYAAASQTVPSLVGLWASHFPGDVAFQPSDDGVDRVSPGVPWVPELFRNAGFRTVAVMSSFDMLCSPASVGFERGFASYDTSTYVRQAHGYFWGFPAHAMVDRAIRAVDDLRDQRFFLWLHLLEPHAAYEQYPGAPLLGERDVDRYHSEVWGIDAEVGRLLDHLESRGMIEQTIVLLTGDHGESFGEHGYTYHGNGLPEDEIHTPCVLWAPGVKSRTVDIPSSHLDIGPTLMNLANVRDGFDRLDGRSLLPLLNGLELSARPIVVGYFFNSRVYTPTAAVAYIDWPWKLFMQPTNDTLQLFDLEHDREEENDLSVALPLRTGPMQDTVSRYFEVAPK